MKYPKTLEPNRTEHYIFEDVDYEIPVVDLIFKQWTGKSIGNTFGGKYLVDYAGIPMFAELATQRLAVEDGWDSRWVETYAMKASGPYLFTDWNDYPLTGQVSTPINHPDLERKLATVAEINHKSYSGCWDALAWKDKSVLFIELKRTKKDAIRSTQLKWLQSALAAGFKLDNFLIVQWDFEEK